MNIDPQHALLISAEDGFNRLLPAKPVLHISQELVRAGLSWSALVWDMAVVQGPVPLTSVQISSGLQLAQNAVFVCGVHRSGTTLLHDLLNDHPDILTLPAEGSFYTQLAPQLNDLPAQLWAQTIGQEWLRRLANPINRAPYWLLGRSTARASPYVNFTRYLQAWWQALPRDNDIWPHLAVMLAYASCTNKLNAHLWVDKTPCIEHYLHRIRRQLPSAKLVQMVREPLATLSSRKKMEPGVNFQTAVKQLTRSFKIATRQSRAGDSNYMLLSYEELCNEPQKTMIAIAAFLNVPFASSLLHPSVAGKPVAPNSSFGNSSVPGTIVASKPNRASTALNNNDIQLISVMLHKASGKLGYHLPSVNITTKLWVWVKYILSVLWLRLDGTKR